MKKRSVYQDGFTLTEVIVISIIVAILAIVAIPVYTAYIDSANYKAAAGTCELVAAAISHTNNRGLTIAANDWEDIGLDIDPSNDTWEYSFDGLHGDSAIASNYSVTVKGATGSKHDGEEYHFLIRPPDGTDQWDGP